MTAPHVHFDHPLSSSRPWSRTLPTRTKDLKPALIGGGSSAERDDPVSSCFSCSVDNLRFYELVMIT